MKITKLYINSSLDFKLWNWKRIDEYPTSDGREAEEVIGKYIIAEGCETIFGNVAAYATTFHYSKVLNYDAVFLLGNPVTKYKVNHPVYKYKEVAIYEDNAEVIHVACDWLGIPVITLNIFFDEPEYRTKPLPNRNIYTNIVGSTAYSVLDPIVKHLNLNRDSKVLVYLAEPIIMSTSREGKVTKRIIKFLRNYK